MRILVRTSNWAIWARRLGSFAVPLTLIPILMHRAAAIDTTAFEWVEAVAIFVALLGVVAGIGGLVRIWKTGDQGWGRAISGLILSLLCLAPIGALAVEYVRYPMVDEFSTDPADPPPLVSANLPATATAPSKAIAAAFPNVKTRSYPLPAARMFDIADKLVAERGWDVQVRHVPNDEVAGQLNAIAASLLGFREEIAIRVSNDGNGCSVDVRSASLSPLHEPGANARRVEEFLAALDASVSSQLKDQPAGTADEGSDAEAPPVQAPVIPAPAPRARKR